MKKNNLFACGLMALLMSSGSVWADSYLDWAEQVRNSTKGLQICKDAYSDAIGYGRTESERAKYLPEARRTCGVMKIGFDTTMLTVRQQVDEMADVLKAYHQLVDGAFKKLVPKPNEDPLDYYANSMELVAKVQKQQLKLVELSGSR